MVAECFKSWSISWSWFFKVYPERVRDRRWKILLWYFGSGLISSIMQFNNLSFVRSNLWSLRWSGPPSLLNPSSFGVEFSFDGRWNGKRAMQWEKLQPMQSWKRKQCRWEKVVEYEKRASFKYRLAYWQPDFPVEPTYRYREYRPTVAFPFWTSLLNYRVECTLWRDKSRTLRGKHHWSLRLQRDSNSLIKVIIIVHSHHSLSRIHDSFHCLTLKIRFEHVWF